MNCDRKEKRRQILVWLIWMIAVSAWLVCQRGAENQDRVPVLMGVVSYDSRSGSLFPWEPRYRWKKGSLVKYKAWKEGYRRAKRAALWGRLAMKGVLSMAEVVDRLTASQVRYHLGALPILYQMLEELEVREIIKRHCPSRREIDHGTVALVLVLNRLSFPLPLYRIADWMGQTVLAEVLGGGIRASQFNDDRLGRTLDALSPQVEQIWQEVLEQALVKFEIDLSVLFYDLSGIISHGRHQDSEIFDFGFAHNTPSNKRKFKLGLNASADGNIPWLYQVWSGRSDDLATVEQNMENLSRWLKAHAYQPQQSMVVGDRATLSDDLALAYDDHGLRYLSGLRCLKNEHKALLTRWSEAEFKAHPLQKGSQPQYWGRSCQVRFENKATKAQVCHKGLVILSAPVRDQRRQDRQKHLADLDQELRQVKSLIGQPRMRTPKAILSRAQTRLRHSKVGHLITLEVSKTPSGQLALHWQLNQDALTQAQRRDGRYLLVTNNYSLSHQDMFRLYCQKDGVEKCFRLSKSDLKISPLYLHKDDRIRAMVFINMLALLTYTLLQRQLQHQGFHLTTRQLITRLQALCIIETLCHDGSSLRRLTPLDPDLMPLFSRLAISFDPWLQLSPPPQVALSTPDFSPPATLALPPPAFN